MTAGSRGEPWQALALVAVAVVGVRRRRRGRHRRATRPDHVERPDLALRLGQPRPRRRRPPSGSATDERRPGAVPDHQQGRQGRHRRTTSRPWCPPASRPGWTVVIGDVLAQARRHLVRSSSPTRTAPPVAARSSRRRSVDDAGRPVARPDAAKPAGEVDLERLRHRQVDRLHRHDGAGHRQGALRHRAPSWSGPTRTPSSTLAQELLTAEDGGNGSGDG